MWNLEDSSIGQASTNIVSDFFEEFPRKFFEAMAVKNQKHGEEIKKYFKYKPFESIFAVIKGLTSRTTKKR